MYTLSNPENRIGGVMVSVFAFSAVDRGFETIKLVSVTFPLSTELS